MQKGKLRAPSKANQAITLQQWQEVVGECVGLFVEDENIIIQLHVNGQKLLLPVPMCQNADISTAVAEKWVGNKIGILKTDDHLEAIAVRIIEKRHTAHDRDGSNGRGRFFPREALKRRMA